MLNNMEESVDGTEYTCRDGLFYVKGIQKIVSLINIFQSILILVGYMDLWLY